MIFKDFHRVVFRAFSDDQRPRSKIIPKLPKTTSVCGCLPSSDGPKAASPPGIRRATAATSAVVGKSRGSKEVAKLIGIKRQLIWKQNKELVVQSRWIAVCFITIAITGSYFNYKTSLNPITAYAAFSVLAAGTCRVAGLSPLSGF